MGIFCITIIAYVTGLLSGYIYGRLEAEREQVDLDERTRKLLAPAEAFLKFQQEEFERERLRRQNMADFHAVPGY